MVGAEPLRSSPGAAVRNLFSVSHTLTGAQRRGSKLHRVTVFAALRPHTVGTVIINPPGTV